MNPADVTAEQLLGAGLRVLDRGGWRQGAYGPDEDPDQPHCAMGALFCGAYVLVDEKWKWSPGDVIDEACRLLQPALVKLLDLPAEDYVGTRAVSLLNDRANTTAEDVKQAFKQAIASIQP